jgi:hypothetical protein
MSNPKTNEREKTVENTHPIIVPRYGTSMFYKNGKHGNSPQEAIFSFATEHGHNLVYVLEEDGGKSRTKALHSALVRVRQRFTAAL